MLIKYQLLGEVPHNTCILKALQFFKFAVHLSVVASNLSTVPIVLL